MKYLIAAQRTLFATVLTVLTACSDSGSTSDIDSRNLDREYSVSIFEGDEGTKTVTLNFESAENSTVSYETFNISAAEKSDYEGVSGSKQVQSGVTYPIEITLYSDTEIEGNEEFGVRFTDESGEVVDEQYIQILNDDLPAISVNSPEVSETDVGTTKLKFQFTLEQEVVDDYQINISSLAEDEIEQLDSNLYPYVAREGDDFEAVEQVLTFTKNEKVKTIDVEVISEDIVEESEVVLLKVTNNEGLNVLSEVYAKGTIRTDETPLINGFDVVLDNEGFPTIEVIEGPADIQLSDSWKAVDVSFSIDKPENIKQSQRLSLRLVTQAEYEAIVDTTASSYVDFEAQSIDICLSLPEESPSETDSCINQQWKELTADQETINFDLYINQDLIREDSEPFLLVVENDQGVVFTTVPGVISNDDQEELLLKLPGSEDLIPLKDMKDQFVELPEPSGTSATYDLELQVTDIAGDYQIGYEILPYLPISPASLSEFDRDKATLTFNENNKSNTISVTLNNDDIYDGDKYIQVNFEEEGLEDIRIRIKDADRPKVAIQSVGNIDGSYESGFEIHEQETVSYGVSAPETQYIDYEFELVILGTTVAFNDLEYDISYDYSIDPSEAEKTACDPNTLALASNQSLFASSDASDFTLLIDSVESPPTLTIDRNTASKRFSVRVHNDIDIECIEQLQISFVPANIDDSEVVESDKRADLNLSISNRDGVEFQLTGFDVSEELAATEVQISSSHLMDAQFELSQVTLPGQSIHACTDASGDISFTDDAFVTQDYLNYTNTINIGPDADVEPDETCNFEVTVSTGNNAFPYRFYADSNQISGHIRNNDVANFDISSSDVSCMQSGVVSEGNEINDQCTVTYALTSDKPIAENVPDLVVHYTRGSLFTENLLVKTLDQTDEDYDVALEYEQEAIEELVTSNGTGFSLKLHETGEYFLPVQNREFTISVKPDQIIETIEVLQYQFSSIDNALYFSYPSEFEFELSIANDDLIEAYILGETNRIEPDMDELSPFRLVWQGEVQLPDSEIPQLTMSHESCVGSITLECLADGEDIVINTNNNQLSLDSTDVPIDYVSLQGSDGLVELPEKIDFTLSTSSPYVKSITVLNQNQEDNDDISDNEVSELINDLLTVSWTLKVDSPEKLELIPEYTTASLSENCSATDNLCNKPLGAISVLGNIAENGPSIAFSVDLSCGSNLNTCATMFQEESIPYDIKSGSNFGVLQLHTYNQAPALPSTIALDVDVFDDELVEHEEQFNIEYTLTEGSAFVDSSSLSTQEFSLTIDDTANLIVERSDETDCEGGETQNGQTIYSEPEDTCDSVYRLKLSKAIAGNVSSINASIVRDTTLLHPLSVKSSATEVGFDVAILSDASEQFSDSFTAPLHTNGSITSADTELAKVTLRHEDDDELEVLESIKLDISSSNSNLVLVGGDNSSIYEGIESNDRVRFSLNESTETVNETSGSMSFTITSNSDIEQLDTDIVLTLQTVNLDSGVEAELGTDYEISLAGDSAFTRNGNQLTLATSLLNYSAISEDIDITLINDHIVEVDETIAFDLVIQDEDSSLVAAVNSSSSEFRAIIESEDRAVITFYPSNDYAEGNTVGNLIHPVAYSLSSSIDSNVPTIYLDIEDMCDQISSADVNCVEFVADVNSSDDSGDVVKPASLQIHTAGVNTEKTDIDQFPQGVAISNLYSRVDNTIEHHETLNLKFKVPVDSDTGRMYGDYLSHIQNANDPLPLDLAYEPESEIVILNDDKLSLTINETNDAYWNSCDGSYDEGIDHENKATNNDAIICTHRLVINESQVVVDYDDISSIGMDVVNGGTALLQSQMIGEGDATKVVNPQDMYVNQRYGSIQYSRNRVELITPTGDGLVSQSILQTIIANDQFVENSGETFELGFSNDLEFVSSISIGATGRPFNWSSILNSDDTATVSIEMISHEDDQENITEGAIIEGNESNVSKLNYKISVDKGFAPEYPAVTASLTKTDSSSETTADYSIEPTSFNLHDGVGGTPVNTDHDVVVDLVTSDSVFELDETISYDLSVNQNQDTDSNNDQISYVIRDDDDLVITFTDPVQGVVEGTSVDTTTPVTLSYNVNNTISSDVPDITIIPQNDDYTNQIEGDDLASGFSGIALHIQNNSGTDTEFTQDQTHTLQYFADSIVEIDEEHAFGYNVVTSDLLSGRISLVYQNSPSGISITLNNDDFVYLSLDCAPDCSQIQEGDTDADSGSINLTVDANYTIEGIARSLNDNKVGVEFSESSPDLVESSDVGLTDAGLVTINQSSSAGDLIPVLNVIGDKAIEKDETSSVSFTLPEFVRFSTGQALTQSFTIKNDDYFSVTTVSGSPMDRMAEGESYTLNICIPNEHSLQSDVPSIALSSTFSSEDIAQSNVSQPLECADVTLSGSQSAACQSPGLISDHVSTLVLNGSNFSGGDCNQMPIFTSLDNEDGYSKWAKLTLSSSSDERFQNFDQNIDLLVVNNDLTNMVDTGLTDCLASDPSLIESCEESNIDHMGQDAAETQDDSQAYQDLKFTYVSDVGDPLLQANNSSCLQDNATGFIWSKPISRGQEYAVVRDQLQSITNLKASYGCGFQDDSTLSWQHPTIEDLMTLLDLSLLGQSHPAQIQYLEETNWTAIPSGSPITHARYWSSTSCGGANYLTLDFSTGIVACTHKNTESAQLIIYK